MGIQFEVPESRPPEHGSDAEHVLMKKSAFAEEGHLSCV